MFLHNKFIIKLNVIELLITHWSYFCYVTLFLYTMYNNCISHIQCRSLLGEILMSTPDLGPPVHYIPTFYQQSAFITLEQDAIVSKLPIENLLLHHKE